MRRWKIILPLVCFGVTILIVGCNAEEPTTPVETGENVTLTPSNMDSSSSDSATSQIEASQTQTTQQTVEPIIPSATLSITPTLIEPTATLPDPPSFAIRTLRVPHEGVVGASGDQRLIVLVTSSQDAVGQPTDFNQIVLYDTETRSPTLVSAAPDGSPGDWNSMAASISDDGSTIAFWSFASNLQNNPLCSSGSPCGAVYIYDVASGSLESIPFGEAPAMGIKTSTALSADGSKLVITTNIGTEQVGMFVYDRTTGALAQLSESALGADVSADGQIIAYVDVVSEDPYALGVFVLDQATNETSRVDLPLDGQESGLSSGVSFLNEGFSIELDMSPNGQFITFVSEVPNLVDTIFTPCVDFQGEERPACSHVYLYDRETGIIELASLNYEGVPGDGLSTNPAVSPDGRWVAFVSIADNLTPEGSAAGCEEHLLFARFGKCGVVYVRDRETGRTYLISKGRDGQLPDGASSARYFLSIDSQLFFTSNATNLVPGISGDGFVIDLLQFVENE